MIYLPNPLIGVRGIHEEIVGAFGQPAAHLGSRLTVQACKALTAEREERGRTPVLALDFSDRPCPCPRRPASLLLAA